MTKILRVSFQRLLECLRYNYDTEFTFNINIEEGDYREYCTLTTHDIKAAIENNVQPRTEHFGKNDNLNEDIIATKEYHLGRVIHFILHPEEIKDIQIRSAWWTQDDGLHSHPHLQIEDGFHRMLAAIYIDPTEISVKNCDIIRHDVLEFLVGDTDEKPEDMGMIRYYADINGVCRYEKY